MARARKAKCPECGDHFELEEYLGEGETTVCPSCDVELKIVKLDPPLLEVATVFTEEDDYDYDEEVDDNERSEDEF